MDTELKSNPEKIHIFLVMLTTCPRVTLRFLSSCCNILVHSCQHYSRPSTKQDCHPYRRNEYHFFSIFHTTNHKLLQKLDEYNLPLLLYCLQNKVLHSTLKDFFPSTFPTGSALSNLRKYSSQ